MRLARCTCELMIVLILFPEIAFSLQQKSNSQAHIQHSKSFCYSQNDMTCNEKSIKWSGTCKSGRRQSPIDLRASYGYSSHVTPQRQTLYFNSDAYVTRSFVTINNGHSVQIEFPENHGRVLMTGYGLNDNYVFSQAHFHWGPVGMPGSEHAVNGIRHSMELHLVYYNEKYESLASAIASDDPRGLAVLGIFLEETPTVNSTSTIRHEFIRPVFTNIPEDYSPARIVVNDTLDLRMVLPGCGAGVFRYEGSLTTPGCSEIVLWSVVKDPVYVSIQDVLKLHSVRDENGHFLVSNSRSLQKVKQNHKVEYFEVL